MNTQYHTEKCAPNPVCAEPSNVVSRRYLAAKRSVDFVCSLFGSIILLPLFLILAVLIWLDDPGTSPIFVQTRVGQGGKRFKMYKFRSMVAHAETMLNQLADKNEMDGPAFKIKKDPRTTRFGRFLRATNLDELPQIWNVLKGDMSFVGPRPPLPQEVAQYTPQQMKRLSITPGITCYWQTKSNRNGLSFDQWMALDMKYIRERNVFVDLKILLQTGAMAFRRNMGEGKASDGTTD